MGIPEHLKAKITPEETQAIKNGCRVMCKGGYTIYIKDNKEILRVKR